MTHPRATTTTKAFAIALLLLPLVIVGVALTEDPYSEMTEANRKVEASAYNICKAYEEAGQGTHGCDKILESK